MKDESAYKGYDVVVVGAGPGGLPAALAAAREGMRVLVVDRARTLGGNGVSGLPYLGYLDGNGVRNIGGLAEAFMETLRGRGAAWSHRRCPMHNSVTLADPEQFKLLMVELCLEAGVELLLYCELIEARVEAGRIAGLTVMGKGRRYAVEGKIYIDATGDGDLAFLAGVPTASGQADTGELQPPTLLFNLGGVNLDRFIDSLEERPEMLSVDEGMTACDGWNADFFRSDPSFVFLGMLPLIERLRAKGDCPVLRNTVIFINTLHQGHVTVNTTRVYDFDGSKPEDLTRGTIECHLQIPKIIAMMKAHIPGFEDCYLQSVQPVIGVRESRRARGIKTLYIDAVLACEKPEDSIALGSYKVDVHSGSSPLTKLAPLPGAYGIPYGCLVAEGLDNLILSGRCISMDANALGSVRVMPTCMAIGEAAGVGAALAVRAGVAPAAVPPGKVRAVLLAHGAILA